MMRAHLAIVVIFFALGCGPRRAGDAGETTKRVDDARTSTDTDAPSTPPDAADTPSVPIDASLPSDAHVASTPGGPSGSVSGTAFWLGTPPPGDKDRQFHFGDAHPRDWEGSPDDDFRALEDVVVVAVPMKSGSATRGSTPSWPEPGTLTCERGRHCPAYVTVASGERLELLNFKSSAVSWNVVKDGRLRLTITIGASQTEPSAIDISTLEPGAYELTDPASSERRGWIYRAAPDEIVVGPTNGNCRYSISLATGLYRIAAWHPHLGAVVMPVEIHERKTKRVNPVFSKKNL